MNKQRIDWDKRIGLPDEITLEKDKNMEQTILIKRSIDKDGLPKQDGDYFTSHGQLEYKGRQWRWSYDGREIEYVTHWYEEISKYKLLEDAGSELPNDEEIRTDSGRRFDIGDRYRGYITGSAVMRQLALPIIEKLKEDARYSEEQKNLCADQCDIYRRLALKTCNERDVFKQESEDKEKNVIAFVEWTQRKSFSLESIHGKWYNEDFSDEKSEYYKKYFTSQELYELFKKNL